MHVKNKKYIVDGKDQHPYINIYQSLAINIYIYVDVGINTASDCEDNMNRHYPLASQLA